MCLITPAAPPVIEGGHTYTNPSSNANPNSHSREGEQISELLVHRRDEEEGDGAEYLISRDIVDFSSMRTKSTDFEFLVGRVGAYL